MAGFALRRLIVAVMVNMLMGLAMTAAAGLAMVGSLNPIYVAFAVLFVGIGVDFGIQFSVRYREERFRDDDLRRALNAAGAKASLPLALAAAATAAGFLFLHSDRLPRRFRTRPDRRNRHDDRLPDLDHRLAGAAFPAAPASGNPGRSAMPSSPRSTNSRCAIAGGIVAAALGLAIIGAPLLLKVRFDYNPLNLRSSKTESVSTLLDIMQDPHMTPNVVEILEPSLDDANALAVKLRALPEVENVATLSDFVPDDEKAKLAMIADARSLLGPSLDPVNPPAPPTDAEDARALTEAGAALRKAAEGKPALDALARAGAALETLGKAPEAARVRARALLIAPMKVVLEEVRLSLQAAPVTLSDLPAQLRRDWIAADGRARMEVAPRGDKNDYEKLRPFVNAVLKAAPNASGAPVGILASGDTVLKAFAEAGGLAFVSIALLLYIALRRIGDVALTLAPLALAEVYTMEICALIGLKLNFANIIALPLLLGLGVAFKIYYVIAWRAGSAKLLRTGLTRAIFFSALTTATAFGSLWLSSHPGTSSMGKLLALSLATTLCAAILFQPALMGPPRVSRENEP